MQLKIRLPLDGIPAECPHCGEAPAEWPLTANFGAVHVSCPSCFTVAAPVVAVAADSTLADEWTQYGEPLPGTE